MTSNDTKELFKKNMIITILVIITICLIALIIFNKLNSKENLLELNELSYKEDTFANVSNDDYDYSTGVVELKGYAEVVNRGLPNVSDDSFVFFHILESSSNEFMSFINSSIEYYRNNGIYVRENAIGIGCLSKDKIIEMDRFGDKYNGEEDYSTVTLSKSDSKKIMDSSKDKPVKIIVRKDLDTSLVGSPPLCLTLITGVELVK